jgi:DNA-binding ferritin-like protein
VTKEGEEMLENALDKIAEQIIALDEASLTQLRKLYLDRLFDFEPTKEWEKAVIIYFIINGVIAKNNLFNHHILEGQKGETQKGPEEDPKKKKGGRLRVVK